MSRLDKVSTDAQHLREWLEKGVILRDGEGWIKLADDDPVYVAIVVDVQGYGPHEGAIFVDQNRYHASADSALQGAYEIFEEYELNHADKNYLEELQEEWGEDWFDIMTETYDAVLWELSSADAIAAIRGTDAEKFITIDDEVEEPADDVPLHHAAVARNALDLLQGAGRREVPIWDDYVVSHINYTDAYEGEVEELEYLAEEICPADDEHAEELIRKLHLDVSLPSYQYNAVTDVWGEIIQALAKAGYKTFYTTTLPGGGYNLGVAYDDNGDAMFGFVFSADAEAVQNIRDVMFGGDEDEV